MAVVALYSNDPSSNAAWVYNVYFFKLLEKNNDKTKNRLEDSKQITINFVFQPTIATSQYVIAFFSFFTVVFGGLVRNFYVEGALFAS